MFKRLLFVLMIAAAVMASASQLSSAQDNPSRPRRDLDTGQLPIERAPDQAGRSGSAQPSIQAAPLQATGMADWSKLTYQSYAGGWDIFTANGDGTNAVRLTSAGTPDITPRLNRGATRIVYVSSEPGNYEILAMDRDGRNRVRLTNQAANDYNPAWSPDGSKILFNSYRDGQSEIYVMNANGTNVVRLTYDPAYDGQPVWSPDSSQIAFLSDRSGSGQIWVMAADGHGPSQLTSLAYAESPAWSPDGTRIAFDADADGDGWQELMLMNANGSNARVIGDTGTTADMWARGWSPDGRMVTFTNIYFIYYYGNWYWTAAYLYAADTVAGGAYALGGSDVDWYPDWQTTDVLPPTSSMIALPATSPSPFVVKWAGADVGPAGIGGYDVQVKDGAGAWTMWLTRTLTTSANFPGVGGHTYSFRVRAVDNSSNVQAWPASAQVSTSVDGLPPISSINALPAYYRGELPVSWSGSDPGGSGIKSYDVQYRDGITGTWTNWQTATTATTAVFGGVAGHTYYFRVRAIDRGQNQESWPIDGQQFSTQYRWQLTGQTTDNRGVPVADIDAATMPAALVIYPGEADAIYHAYGATEAATNTVTWPSAAYGEPVATRFWFDAQQDARQDVVMPPNDNVVHDNSFESALFDAAGWSASGSLTPALVSDRYGTGQYAARLGHEPFQLVALSLVDGLAQAPAQPPVLATDDEGNVHIGWQIGGTVYYRWRDQHGAWSVVDNLQLDGGSPATARIVFDHTGTMHVMWNDYQANYYRQHPLRGAWSALQTTAVPSWAGQPPQMTVDDRGHVHAVWEGIGSTYVEIYYAYRTSTGVWSTPQSLSPGYACQHAFGPQIAADHVGQIHLVYSCGTFQVGYAEVVYQLRNAGGQWSGRVNLSQNDYQSQAPQLAVDAQGRVHVVWLDWYAGSNWGYAQRSADGVWTAPAVLAGTTTASDLQLAVDSAGLAQLAWIDTADNLVYAARQQSNGSWTNPAAVSATNETEHPRLTAGLNADMHLAWTTTITPTQEVFYTYRNRAGEWQSVRNLSNTPVPSTQQALTIDRHGQPHLIWLEDSQTELIYAGSPNVAADEDSDIRQVITVPLTATAPTLSWLYQFDGAAPLTGTWLSARLDGGVSAPIVFSTTTATTGWQHQWLDVSAWAGQTMTITFSLHQTGGDAATRAYIDDVTLGSWLTPDPHAITPSHIKLPATQVITITGDNFFATPQVRVNDTPLSDVTWINTTTLTATVPALPFGRYDLIVTNPGGQASGLPRALLVGYEVLLPLVRK